jgi:hypothetical protein
VNDSQQIFVRLDEARAIAVVTDGVGSATEYPLEALAPEAIPRPGYTLLYDIGRK